VVGITDAAIKQRQPPPWTAGAVPRDFRLRMLRLLGDPLLKAAFGAFVNVEDIQPQNGAGKIAVIVPNDS
jgi:hypothetical protein